MTRIIGFEGILDEEDIISYGAAAIELDSGEIVNSITRLMQKRTDFDENVEALTLFTKPWDVDHDVDDAELVVGEAPGCPLGHVAADARAGDFHGIENRAPRPAAGSVDSSAGNARSRSCTCCSGIGCRLSSMPMRRHGESPMPFLQRSGREMLPVRSCTRRRFSRRAILCCWHSASTSRRIR